MPNDSKPQTNADLMPKLVMELFTLRQEREDISRAKKARLRKLMLEDAPLKAAIASLEDKRDAIRHVEAELEKCARAPWQVLLS